MVISAGTNSAVKLGRPWPTQPGLGGGGGKTFQEKPVATGGGVYSAARASEGGGDECREQEKTFQLSCAALPCMQVGGPRAPLHPGHG